MGNYYSDESLDEPICTSWENDPYPNSVIVAVIECIIDKTKFKDLVYHLFIIEYCLHS